VSIQQAANQRINEREDERLQERGRERESGRSDDGCRQQIGERERRSGFAVKIAQGRRGFARGSRRAYATGEDRLQEREVESIGWRCGAWKEAAEY
jgi:hypothetical protein